jgi:glutaredoxin
MKKKTIISMVLFVVVLIFSIIILVKNESQKINNSLVNDSSNIVLFYGEGCPHCLIVEDYINKNNVLDKIAITQKEVYSNDLNARELKEKAGFCKLATNSIGVPFLWDGSNCYIGDVEIINFLKSKISQ